MGRKKKVERLTEFSKKSTKHAQKDQKHTTEAIVNAPTWSDISIM